jgi:nucleolar protein 4
MAAARTQVVFVRNLAFDATGEALERHFESIGPVRESWVVLDRKTHESRGFGFVGFVLADDAERAVSQLNGSTLGGRRITVDLAKKKGEATGHAPAAPSSKAVDSSAPAARKRAAPAAETGASGTDVPAPPAAKRGKPARPVRQRHRVILRNLAFTCTAEVLREAVGAHAEVLDVHLPSRPDGKPPGFAFVELPTAEACEVVVRALNETKINGRTVAVDVAMHKAGYEKAAAAGGSEKAALAVGSDKVATAGIGDDKAGAAGASVGAQAGGSAKAKAAVDSGAKAGGLKKAAASVASSGASKAGGSVLGGAVAGKQAGKRPKGALSKDEEDEAEAESKSEEESGEEEEEEEEEEGGGEEAGGGSGLTRKGKVEGAGEDSEGMSESGSEREGVDGDGKSEGEKEDESESESEGEAESEGEGEGDREADALLATVFVKGLPIEATEAQLAARFKLLGSLRYARVVTDAATGLSRGTAFVRFETPAGAQVAVGAVGLRLLGHPLTVTSAVERGQAASAAAEKRVAAKPKPERTEGGKRNLHLARYGLVLSGEEGAENFSAADLRKREAAWAQKKEKLASPNFSVSATRLSVRNLPPHIDEKVLRSLAVAAAGGGAAQSGEREARAGEGGRAKQGQPGEGGKANLRHAAKRGGERLVKQAKIVRDENRRDRRGEPRSRGFGFVEFGTHEHALAALKHLADNPRALEAHGGKGRLLLVEFAVDSVQKLKLHEDRRLAGAQAKAREAAANGAARAAGKIGAGPVVGIAAPATKQAHGKPGAAGAGAPRPAANDKAAAVPSKGAAATASGRPAAATTASPGRPVRPQPKGNPAVAQKGTAVTAAPARPVAKGNPARRERLQEVRELNEVLGGPKRPGGGEWEGGNGEGSNVAVGKGLGGKREGGKDGGGKGDWGKVDGGQVEGGKRRRVSAEAKEEARFDQLVGSYKKMLGVGGEGKTGASFAAKLGEWTK